MKKHFILFSIILSSILFFGCSSKVDTSLTFRNMAAGSILINFRGEAINVPAGQTVVLKAVPRGTYTYSSTFSIPAGASNAVSQGAVSGEVNFRAGTKVLVIFSSTLIDGTYTIFATISSSDDLDDDGNNPTAP